MSNSQQVIYNVVNAGANLQYAIFILPSANASCNILYAIERVSIECRKTKTKVITLANQKGRRQSSKPIKTRSNYT